MDRNTNNKEKKKKKNAWMQQLLDDGSANATPNEIEQVNLIEKTEFIIVQSLFYWMLKDDDDDRSALQQQKSNLFNQKQLNRNAHAQSEHYWSYYIIFCSLFYHLFYVLLLCRL